MDTSRAKQEMILLMDRIIYWRRGVLEVDPANEENAHCLKLLISMREEVSAMRDADREFARLAEIQKIAAERDATGELDEAGLIALRRYGAKTEPAHDPYTFVQDFILDLVVAIEIAHGRERSHDILGGRKQADPMA